jgi:LysR family transcriptional regulator, nitrogen assimilation regulatory protein
VWREVAIVCARNRPPIPSQWQVLRTVREQIINLVNSGTWPDTQLAC